jgi:hypothetical protein
MVAMDRSQYPTRRRRLQDAEDHSYIRGLTMSERVMMVWPLTLQAWAFLDGMSNKEKDLEPRLRRHVVRVVRGTG